MTFRDTSRIRFKGTHHKRVEIAFDGGGILLRVVDRRQRLLKRVAGAFEDRRQRGKTDHTALQILRQRVFGLVLGYDP